MHSLAFTTAAVIGVATATGHFIQARDGTVTVTVTTIPEYCTPGTPPLATTMSPVVIQSGTAVTTESLAVPIMPSTTEAAGSVPVAFTNGTVPGILGVPTLPGTAPTEAATVNATVTTSTPSQSVESPAEGPSSAPTEISATPAPGSAGSGPAVSAGFLVVAAALAGSFVALA